MGKTRYRLRLQCSLPNLPPMPTDATFESFREELNRLVESFGNRIAELQGPDYNEAKLRDDFLNPFFRALGWDLENRAGLIQKKREVEIESLTRIGGGHKRADYLFRVRDRDRLVCEAKKPGQQFLPRTRAAPAPLERIQSRESSFPSLRPQSF